MLVKDLMTKKVIKVDTDATLGDVAKLFLKENISGAPVVNHKGEMVGFISEKDLFKALYPNFRDIITDFKLWIDKGKGRLNIHNKKNILIESIMAQEVKSIAPEDLAVRAGSVMLVESINHLPVLDDGKVVGIITRSDIYRKILKTELDI